MAHRSGPKKQRKTSSASSKQTGTAWIRHLLIFICRIHPTSPGSGLTGESFAKEIRFGSIRQSLNSLPIAWAPSFRGLCTSTLRDGTMLLQYFNGLNHLGLQLLS